MSTTGRSATLIIVLTSLSSSLLLSLARFAYARLIVPQYGQTATEIHLNHVLFPSTILALSLPVRFKSPFLLAGAVAAASPSLAYYVAAKTARYGSPIWGPIATHAAVLSPLALFLGVSVKQSPLPLQSTLCFSATSLLLLVYLPNMWQSISIVDGLSDNIILFFVAGCLFTQHLYQRLSPQDSLTRSAKTSQKSSEKKQRSSAYKPILYPAFLTIWIVFARSALQAPLLQDRLKAPYIHPNFPLKIYSSKKSITGAIVVGEGLKAKPEMDIPDVMQEIRYLRADHSILGGVWTQGKVASLDGTTNLRDKSGEILGDSIYGTFVLQEAVRLMEKGDHTGDIGTNSALIIGLGTGIAAQALQRHKMSATIVEIDPAVFEAAVDYFGLQHPGQDKIFLEDAGTWVARRRSELQASPSKKDLFDVVIHDCFSGGGVPEHIFTVEFWAELKDLIHEEGIVAVNFAGVVSSDASRSVLLTLLTIFNHCRVFHDHLDKLEENAYSEDFMNLVFFCTPSTKPLAFRQARQSDFLNSHLRRHMLSTLPDREINQSVILGNVTADEKQKFILTRQSNNLGALQLDEALRHWSLMREVLSDVFWETY